MAHLLVPRAEEKATLVTSPMRKTRTRASLRLALVKATEDESVRSVEPEKPHVFVCLAADYGNLGDLAITRAQIEFLKSATPDSVVEVLPISRSLGAIKRLRRVIRPSDVVTLIGGGNTGDMYDDIQYLRELAIRSFPNNRIISFPQTIDFSASLYGRWARRNARRVYNTHPDLTVLARDSKSRQEGAQLFDDCRVLLAPDVVLTLDESAPALPREGVLLALRSDLEQGLDEKGKAAVFEAASSLGSVRRADTHVGDVRVDAAQAERLLDEFWSQCRSSELMVTDRLHGMIFSVITGTPCLALDSGTGKVSQFYRDWLQNFPGVELITEPQEVSRRALRLVPSHTLDRAALRERVRESLGEAIRSNEHHGA